MEIVPNTFAGLAGPEIELFQKHLAGIKGCGVEIGCLDGFSTVVILESSQIDLISIDPFVPDSMEASLIGNLDRFHANIAKFRSPVFGRIQLIQDFSYNVAKTWKIPLDFLFIDGDHTYEAVKQDFNDWTPWLCEGGLLAMHDARMGRPGGANFHQGSSQAAAELLFNHPEHWEIVGEAFSLVIARKK